MAENTADMPLSAKEVPLGGSYKVTASAATTIGGATTPAKAAGTTAAVGASKGFTVATTNRITCNERAEALYLAVVNAALDIAAATDAVTLHLYKNGAAVAGAERTVTVTAGTPLAVNFSSVVSLKTGDYLELWVENEDAAVNITVTEAYVSVIGG